MILRDLGFDIKAGLEGLEGLEEVGDGWEVGIAS
jgi:hypothetical protein